MGGCGTQTAALAIFGYFHPPGANAAVTEQYDGTSWTEVGDANTARYGNVGIGITTAALSVGGTTDPPTLAIVEQYNGTAWTEVADLNTARQYGGGVGTTTDALYAGGIKYPSPGAAAASTESYDGTSWTEVGSLSGGRQYVGTSGTAPSALLFGGSPAPLSATTEFWDGSAWGSSGTMGTGRDLAGGTPAGTQSLALAIGGGGVATTEEYSVPAGAISIVQEGQVWYNTTSTVLKGFGMQGTGAWASGGAVPVSIYSGMYCGTQTAGIYGG